MSHPLHEVIAELLKQHVPNGAQLIVDDAGKGDQKIPLFTGETKSSCTRLCCVDALVIVGGKIRLLVEVDESNNKPTHILGKYLTSALSSFYVHDREDRAIPKSKHTSFLQIVSTKKLKGNSKKPEQWRVIEETIRSMPAIGEITNYRLFAGDVDDFEIDGNSYAEVGKFIQDSIREDVLN